MAVTGKSGKNDGRKPNRFRPFPKRGGMNHHQPPMPFLPPPPWQVRQPKSSDDRHVMAKHASLYPANLPAFQKMVSACEKALKLVSDQLSTDMTSPPPTDEENNPNDTKDGVKKEEEEQTTTTPSTTGGGEEEGTTGEAENSPSEIKEDIKDENKDEEKEEAGSSPTKPTETKKETPSPAPSNKDQQRRDYHNRGQQDNIYRSLKGVQRVGVFGHGLLLQDDEIVDLVALSAEKPTESLLQQIYDHFPTHLSTVTDDKYDVELQMESCVMMVTREKEPKIACRITLTSPQMRSNNIHPDELVGGDQEEPSSTPHAGDNNNGDHKSISGSNGDEEEKEEKDTEETAEKEGEGEDTEMKTEDEKSIEEKENIDIDPPDVLNREICLEALAQLRRAKWFQAQARGLPNCVVVLRILRDLAKRVPEWEHLTLWSMELLVQKCIASVRVALGPGNALRRVFECLSVGIILPLGNGLYDPCEREPTDPLTGLSVQNRETITASAQHMLRLMAFRRIRTLLDMEPLPTPRRKYKQQKKRKLEKSEANNEATEKKDKKEEGEEDGEGQQLGEGEGAVAEDDEDELLEEDEEDCVATDA